MLKIERSNCWQVHLGSSIIKVKFILNKCGELVWLSGKALGW